MRTLTILLLLTGIASHATADDGKNESSLSNDLIVCHWLPEPSRFIAFFASRDQLLEGIPNLSKDEEQLMRTRLIDFAKKVSLPVNATDLETREFEIEHDEILNRHYYRVKLPPNYISSGQLGNLVIPFNKDLQVLDFQIVSGEGTSDLYHAYNLMLESRVMYLQCRQQLMKTLNP